MFVDLRIAPSGNPQRATSDITAAVELAGNRPIWDFLRVNSFKATEGMALAIIGPPGCGKTTLLQHVATTLASNRQQRYRVRRSIPILLFLRDHVATLTKEKPPPLAELVERYFSDASLFASLDVPKGWFERQIERGRCMVLLDGLDEVAGLEQRKAVAKWVDTQIKNYSNCRFVLTARPQGYRDAPLERAHVLEVQPFNAEQVRRFIENWYLANEIKASGGQDDKSVRYRANKDARDLLQRLSKTPALSALTVNPLLLTMIAMVHRYHGALPGSRVELYAEICEVLLGRWRQARGVQDPLNAARKLVVLRPLAAYMMEQRLRDIEAGRAMAIMAPHLIRIGLEGKNSEDFLNDLQFTSGLILEREVGHWSFAHLTFQEYLTAIHWHEDMHLGQDWDRMVGDSWWHETLRLYVAQGDATAIVNACLDVDDVSTLSLAGDCLDEARELDPLVRKKIIDRLIADLESPIPARRRLAAEVQLTRRLKSLQRIDDKRAIDLDYISCAEYQLFVDEMFQQTGSCYQPDHWTNATFTAGQALDAVGGLRFEDVRSFCEWLTVREGGNFQYRLPQTEEAEKFRAQSAKKGLATWCENDGAQFLVGLDSAIEQEIRAEMTKLSGAAWNPPRSLAFSIDECIRQTVPYYTVHANRLTAAIALDRILGPPDDRTRNFINVDLIETLRKDRPFRALRYWLNLLSVALRHSTRRLPTRGGILFVGITIVGFTLLSAVYVVFGSSEIPTVIALLAVVGALFFLGSDTLSDTIKLLDVLRTVNLDRAFNRAIEKPDTSETAFSETRSKTRREVSREELDGALHRAQFLIDVFDLNFALDLDRAFDRSLELSETRTTSRTTGLRQVTRWHLFPEKLSEALREWDFHSAERILLEFQKKQVPPDSKLIRLLLDVLATASANSPSEAKFAEKRYVADLLESILMGYEGMYRNDLRSGIFRWLKPSKGSKELRQQQEFTLQLYWWLRVVCARRHADGLRLWDGIRIIREQVT